MAVVHIDGKRVIPENCLRFQTSRSSGPGGQNVNKLNTRVTVIFDPASCPTLTGVQKQRLFKKLASRIDKDGCLRISSQRYRRQHANRQDALDRLTALVADAVKPPVKRRRTAVPNSAIRKRLEQKKRRSQAKRLRSKPDIDKE